MSTEFISKHAATLAKFAAETAAKAKEYPDDFLLELAAQNQEEAAQAVARELALAQAEEAGELLNLRFIGPKADGSILLDTFIKIAEPLSRAWKLAAHRLRYGQDASRLDSSIGDALNLKLAGMAYGSTRILVTGNGRPDLTGESLLQTTLTQTFRVLTSTNEEFFDAVDAMGGRAAHQLGEAIKAIDNAGLAAEFSWRAPSRFMIWDGRSDEVTRIRTLLDTIQEPEVSTETISGYLAGITDTGRLELRTSAGKIPIRFPLKLTDLVQHLAIAKPATLHVETARYWDAVAKKDVFKRRLLDVIK